MDARRGSGRSGVGSSASGTLLGTRKDDDGGVRGPALRRGDHRRRPQRARQRGYLARAGLTTLVLEQRHVLGGAAVTEELFPGFRFSVFSYVVSLLLPEIIRDLQLPRHGLDILPLDGTFTPLHKGDGPKAGGGDYLWRVNDHGRTIRELRRW